MAIQQDHRTGLFLKFYRRNLARNRRSGRVSASATLAPIMHVEVSPPNTGGSPGGRSVSPSIGSALGQVGRARRRHPPRRPSGWAREGCRRRTGVPGVPPLPIRTSAPSRASGSGGRLGPASPPSPAPVHRADLVYPAGGDGDGSAPPPADPLARHPVDHALGRFRRHVCSPLRGPLRGRFSARPQKAGAGIVSRNRLSAKHYWGKMGLRTDARISA